MSLHDLVPVHLKFRHQNLPKSKAKAFGWAMLGKLLTSPNTASPQELKVVPREQRNSNLVKSLKVEMGFC